MLQCFDYYIYIKTNKNHLNFEIKLSDNIVAILNEQKRQVRNFPRVSSNQAELPWKLVYYEHGHDLASAKERCKKLQKLAPSKRIALIERHNPSWNDLGTEWLK